MASESEAAVRPADARPDTRSRFRRWATRRARQLGFAGVVLLALAALAAAGGWAYRWASLVTLPDVGEGFAEPAVRPEPIPAGRDAFAILREATARVRRRPGDPNRQPGARANFDWSKASPPVRNWVGANREALDLFRKASEQADGVAHPGAAESEYNREHNYLFPFVEPALLEASRLEGLGDMPGAWVWYRALIAMLAHFSRRGTMYERHIAAENCEPVAARVALWAADPRTGIADLRRALDDVVGLEPRPEWDASSLRINYLLASRELDRLDGPLALHGSLDDRPILVAGEPLPPGVAQQVHAARRYLAGEPERSRRVLRLAYANWLAHVETPSERRRQPAVRASFSVIGSPTTVGFYALGPSSPGPARALGPRDLADRLLGSPDAKALLMQWPWPAVRAREQRDHYALATLLAGELYRRDRGQPPPTDQSLVGPYLDHLPDDGTADLDDGTATRVGETARD